MKAKMKVEKRAWVRDSTAPIGQPARGRISCPCNNAPLTYYKKQPNIVCNCGRIYKWDGRIVNDSPD